MAVRDYESAPVAEELALKSIILGLAEDLTLMRKGEISAQEGIARATVAKQIFNGVRLYLQAVKTLESAAKSTGPETLKQVELRAAE